jgi:hypothetical protein
MLDYRISAGVLGFKRLDSRQHTLGSRPERYTNRVPSFYSNLSFEWVSDGQQDTTHTQTLIWIHDSSYTHWISKSYVSLFSEALHDGWGGRLTFDEAPKDPTYQRILFWYQLEEF